MSNIFICPRCGTRTRNSKVLSQGYCSRCHSRNGRDERDEAMDRVLSNSGKWSVNALIRVNRLPRGWIGTGEDIRLELTHAGLPPPHHHNAWGGMINACVRQGVLEWTQRLGQMRVPRSHARSTKVYKKT